MGNFFGTPPQVCRAISSLRGLTALNLDNNSRVVDDDICQLTRLRSLKLNFTRITPNALRLLTGLTELELESQNEITSKDITHLTRLTALNISRNAHIGDEALHVLCSSLVSLDFGCFGARTLVTADGLRTCEHLTRLGLCDDYLQCITVESMKCLRKLKVVYTSFPNQHQMMQLNSVLGKTHPHLRVSTHMDEMREK
jgi:hypothetical protein